MKSTVFTKTKSWIASYRNIVALDDAYEHLIAFIDNSCISQDEKSELKHLIECKRQQLLQMPAFSLDGFYLDQNLDEKVFTYSHYKLQALLLHIMGYKIEKHIASEGLYKIKQHETAPVENYELVTKN